MKYAVTMYPDMGRGLTTLHSITKGTIITECELLMLSPKDTKTVNTTDLQYYTFKVDSERDCLVLGDGEIFNHSDTPNTGYKLTSVDGRYKMQFYALEDIQ